MRAHRVPVSLLIHFVWPLLFVALIFFQQTVSSQSNQQNTQQQRPRTVGTNQNTNARPTNQSQTNSAEEVGEGDVVRVETQLVTVPAVVTTEAPFEIALLLDTSGSTRDDLGLIRDAANAFISALRAGDRISVVAFNNERGTTGPIASVDVLTPLTDKRTVLRTAVANLGTSNGTPFYDALLRIGDQVFHDPPTDQFRGRRAIVALTDGVDSTSNSDFDEARTKLSRAGVAAYFIQVSTEDYVEDRLLKDCQDDGRLTLSAKQLERFRRLFVPSAQREDYQDFCQLGQFERMDISRQLYNLARREMGELARATGGKNFSAASLQEASAAFAQVANEIGTQYSLGYYPSDKTRDGRFRQIKVELRGIKDANVRARDGYYAPKR